MQIPPPPLPSLLRRQDRNLQTMGTASWAETTIAGEDASERLAQDENAPPFAPFYWGAPPPCQGAGGGVRGGREKKRSYCGWLRNPLRHHLRKPKEWFDSLVNANNQIFRGLPWCEFGAGFGAMGACIVETETRAPPPPPAHLLVCYCV